MAQKYGHVLTVNLSWQCLSEYDLTVLSQTKLMFIFFKYKSIELVQVSRHSFYSWHVTGDMGLMSVYPSFVFHEAVWPICIAMNFPMHFPPDKYAMIAGFGQICM